MIAMATEQKYETPNPAHDDTKARTEEQATPVFPGSVRTPRARQDLLQLRDAARVVGNNLYEGSWTDDVLDSPNSRPLKAIREEIHEALLSGHVLAFVDDGRRARRFKMKYALDPTFAMDISCNQVRLRRWFDHPLGLWISEKELKRYLVSVRKDRRVSAPTIRAVRECEVWLENQIGAHEGLRKKYLFQLAQRDSGISETKFDELCRSACVRLGKTTYFPIGRPRKTAAKQ